MAVAYDFDKKQFSSPTKGLRCFLTFLPFLPTFQSSQTPPRHRPLAAINCYVDSRCGTRAVPSALKPLSAFSPSFFAFKCASACPSIYPWYFMTSAFFFSSSSACAFSEAAKRVSRSSCVGFFAKGLSFEKEDLLIV